MEILETRDRAGLEVFLRKDPYLHFYDTDVQARCCSLMSPALMATLSRASVSINKEILHFIPFMDPQFPAPNKLEKRENMIPYLRKNNVVLEQYQSRSFSRDSFQGLCEHK